MPVTIHHLHAGFSAKDLQSSTKILLVLFRQIRWSDRNGVVVGPRSQLLLVRIPRGWILFNCLGFRIPAHYCLQRWGDLHPPPTCPSRDLERIKYGQCRVLLEGGNGSNPYGPPSCQSDGAKKNKTPNHGKDKSIAASSLSDGQSKKSGASPAGSLESGSNPRTSSHGHYGAELTKRSLSVRTSKQNGNCNAKLDTSRLPFRPIPAQDPVLAP